LRLEVKPEALPEEGTLALLVEIRDEIRRLRADLAAKRVLDSEQFAHDADAAIVREVAAFLGTGCAFSAAELIDGADEHLRSALAGLDASQLGRLLARAEGCDMGGVRVVRCKCDQNGVVWRIAATN
jgi:hypothetical protein